MSSMRWIKLCLLAVLTLGLADPASAMVGVSQPSGQPLDLVVQYRSSAAAAAAGPSATSLDLIRPGKRIMKFLSENELQQAMTRLRGDPNVEYVNRGATVTAQFVPNDPLYSQQWDKKIQRLDVADGTETGGSNVIILVSDTAFDCTTIPDLAPNCRQDLSRNFITDPVYFFHGFHVAGIAAAAINNSLAIAGTAGTAKLAFARFLDHTGSGSTADGLLTWNYALQLAQQGFKVVVNNSWGGGGFDQSYVDAAAALKAAGVVVVAAAGNNASDNCKSPFYPAAYENVIAVASTAENDTLSSFSNYGNCAEAVGGVFVAAPGSNILSLSNESAGTRVASGTSMATPQVAGAAALVLSQAPTLSVSDVKERLRQGINLGLPVLTGVRLDLPGVLVPTPPGIRLSLGCPQSSVNQGDSLTCQTSMIGVGGFKGTALLTCGGVPGATCVLSPSTISAGQTANVVLTPSTSTPASPPPQHYTMVVDANASVGSAEATEMIAVWPLGTKMLSYMSTQAALLGLDCTGKPWGTPPWDCPVSNVATTKISVPDNFSILHLTGAFQASIFGNYPNIKTTLTSPAGTALDIPTPTNSTGPRDSAWDTDVFDGQPTSGDWTLTVNLNTTGPPGSLIFSGSLSGWAMKMLAVPGGPPPPPPPLSPSVDFPSLSFGWTSKNTNSCTASGAWSGPQPLNGNLQLNAPYDGTYTLNCMGLGGAAQRSIAITTIRQ